jgi:Histidine kinase-, DNA gyrase B-, and HSP90-like ATPase
MLMRMPDQPFATLGRKTDEVVVSISYRIIELFSGGLYSSPNKAIEELVTNAYDALASDVRLLVPANVAAEDATIWVIDNGESMDVSGLHELWQIASSNKRRDEDTRPRRPIGRFGIGKLATYVLAQQLTHVCKKDGRYLAITMNYAAIPHDTDASTHPVALEVRELTDDEARAALQPLKGFEGGVAAYDWLFDDDAPASWTAAAMSQLKPLARDLKLGRLRWILSTALPMSPQFLLQLNGKRVASAVERREVLNTWTVGRDDEAAQRMELESGQDEAGYYVTFDGLGKVRGTAKVYETELTTGKAAEQGRSHGFFIKVRGRLLNLDDALFGIRALSHTTFARFWMEVEADGLDDFLRSTREAVLDAPPVDQLREYLIAKFNEARAFYTNYLRRQEEETRLSTRIGKTPGSLSRRPLFNAIVKGLEGAVELTLIDVPQGLGDEERGRLVEKLEASLETADGLIRNVEMAPLGTDRYLAAYDALTQTVKVNVLHPFFANYASHYHSPEPFELVAVAEILTEAYLLDELPSSAVHALIDRRDRFFRELVFSGEQQGAPVVAQMLRDAKTNETELEHALSIAFRSLGFEVSKIGGKGKPDGLARARLGVRSTAAEGRDDYQITFDAKSSGHDRVKAKTIGVSTLARHRSDYKAEFAVVVAPDFEGADDDKSALSKECGKEHVTPIRVDDFALLVNIAATRQLGYTRLRELFENCHNVTASHDWIHGLLSEEPEEIPVVQLLETIWELMEANPDPVTFGGLQVALRYKSIDVRVQQLQEWVQSLKSLAPGFISVDDSTVMLDSNVDKVLDVVRLHGGNLPAEVLKKSYLEPLIAETQTSPPAAS